MGQDQLLGQAARHQTCKHMTDLYSFGGTGITITVFMQNSLGFHTLGQFAEPRHMSSDWQTDGRSLSLYIIYSHSGTELIITVFMQNSLGFHTCGQFAGPICLSPDLQTDIYTVTVELNSQLQYSHRTH